MFLSISLQVVKLLLLPIFFDSFSDVRSNSFMFLNELSLISYPLFVVADDISLVSVTERTYGISTALLLQWPCE